MEDVKWLEVTLDTTEAELDALCARLTGNGVTGTTWTTACWPA